MRIFKEIMGVIWALLTILLIIVTVKAISSPEVNKDTLSCLFLGVIMGVLTTIALAQD